MEDYNEQYDLLDKIAKTLSVCFAFCSMALIVVTVSFYISTGQTQEQLVTGLVNYITQNINSAPIQNITISPNPCGALSSSVQLFQWRGTISGCSCSGDIRVNQCDGCNIIVTSEKNILYRWNKRYICVQRATSFWNTDKECPENYRRCTDNLCIGLQEPCPISDIQIIPSISVTDTLQTYPVGDTQKLAIWRNNTSDGLFQFTVSVDNFPCINEDLDPPVTGAMYPLYQSSTNCGDYGQDFGGTFQIQQMDFKQFLLDNNMEGIMKDLTLFGDQYTRDHLAILFARKRVALYDYRPECRDFSQMQLTEVANTYGSLMNMSFIYAILQITLGFILMLLLVSDVTLTRGRMHKFYPYISKGLQWICFAVIFSMVIEGTLNYVYYSRQQTAVDYYRSFGINKCFGNAQINEIFLNFPNLYSDSLENFDTTLQIQLIFALTMFLILLILHCAQMVQCCFVYIRNDPNFDPGDDHYRELRAQKIKNQQNNSYMQIQMSNSNSYYK